MATDIEKLVVSLSADIRNYQRALQNANGVTNRQAAAIEKRWKQANTRLDSIGAGMARSIVTPLAGIAAAASVREVTEYADSWTRAGNQIAAAGQIAGRAGRSLESINDIANSTRSGFEETAGLYARLLRSTAGVAQSEGEVAAATAIVNKAFKAGGAATSEMAAGILQLGQGLSSGILAGDELRSVRENAPVLAKAIADFFGTTVGGLKQLGQEGKLTADKVFKAILAAGPQVEAAFAKTNSTIAEAVTKVNNALTQYIGQTDKGLGATQRLVAGLNAFANDFDNIADITLKVSAVIAGALVGRAITGMIVKLGLGVAALIRFGAALKAVTSLSTLAASFGGLSAAAGPVGLVIGGAVVGALALFSSSSADASASADRFNATLERQGLIAPKAAEGIDKVTAAQQTFAAKVAGIDKDLAAAATETDKFAASIEDALVPFQVWGSNPFNIDTGPAARKVLDLIEKFRDGTISAGDLNKGLDDVAKERPGWAKQIALIEDLTGHLDLATESTRRLNEERARAGAPDVNAATSARLTGLAGYYAMIKAGKEFSAEIERQAGLTKDQLALEKEVAQVRKDAAAEGVTISDAEVKRLAKLRVDADAARNASTKPVPKTADNRFDEDIQGIRDRTAALVEEQQITGLSFEAQEKRRASLDLEQAALRQLREEARKKGIADLDSIHLSDDQVAAIDAATTAYAAQADALRRVQENQERAEQAASDFYDTFKSGAIDAIMGTGSLKDALSGLLKKLGELALNDAFDKLFSPTTGSSSGGLFGNIIGALFGLGGGGGGAATGAPLNILPRAGGGPVKAGQPYVVGEKRPELFVPNQNGMIIPKLPAASGGGGVTFNMPISLSADGADASQLARLTEQVIALKQTVPQMAVKAVRDAQSRRVLQ